MKLTYKDYPTDPALHLKSMALKNVSPSEECRLFVLNGDDIAPKRAKIVSGVRGGHKGIGYHYSLRPSKGLWYLNRYTVSIFYFNLAL